MLVKKFLSANKHHQSPKPSVQEGFLCPARFLPSSKARTGPARPGSGLRTLRVTKSTLRGGKPDPWSRRTWRATTCRPLQTSQGKCIPQTPGGFECHLKLVMRTRWHHKIWHKTFCKTKTYCADYACKLALWCQPWRSRFRDAWLIKPSKAHALLGSTRFDCGR